MEICSIDFNEFLFHVDTLDYYTISDLDIDLVFQIEIVYALKKFELLIIEKELPELKNTFFTWIFREDKNERHWLIVHIIASLVDCSSSDFDEKLANPLK